MEIEKAASIISVTNDKGLCEIKKSRVTNAKRYGVADL